MKNIALFQQLMSQKPTDLLGFIDFDDCLDLTTVRNLTPKQKQILWDLHYLTDGGFIITTNSDGRSIFEMDQMNGFPIISEFATVFRNIHGFNDETDKPSFTATKPNVTAAFKAAKEMAKKHEILLVDTGEELAAKESIKLEEKEMGIAAVFGSYNHLELVATEMVKHAFEQANISRTTHEIDMNGKDAREIKVRGANKAEALDHIEDIARLIDRPFKFAMGDSGSDLELMQRLGRGIVVGNAIKDEKLQCISHLRLQSPNGDFTETWQFLSMLRDALRAQSTGLILSTSQTNPGRRGSLVPRG